MRYKNMELFHTVILHERVDEISRTSNTRPFVRREKKREKKPRCEKWRTRDANIFASRQSQLGESVQKVSLRQRQVITYIHIRTKMEFKVEVNYLVGI